MIVVNFAHPLTPGHLQRLEEITSSKVERVLDVPSQVDVQQPLVPQIVALVEAAGLSPAEWQTRPLLVVLPSLNYSAAALLAELHGRLGYFPAVVRLRPVAGSMVQQFEVAEIVNLQAVREAARGRRIGRS